MNFGYEKERVENTWISVGLSRSVFPFRSIPHAACPLFHPPYMLESKFVSSYVVRGASSIRVIRFRYFNFAFSSLRPSAASPTTSQAFCNLLAHPMLLFSSPPSSFSFFFLFLYTFMFFLSLLFFPSLRITPETYSTIRGNFTAASETMYRREDSAKTKVSTKERRDEKNRVRVTKKS